MDNRKPIHLHYEGESSFDEVLYRLREELCNHQEKLSRNEILEKFECSLTEIFKDKGWLSRKRLGAEFATLFNFMYISFIYVKPSLQTLIKLIDSLLKLIMVEEKEKSFLFRPLEMHILGVYEEKLLVLRDLLSNNEVEIWEYLLTKIHSTAYGIAVFVLICICGREIGGLPAMFVAILLACEIEHLEQEIQEAYCGDRNLKLEGWKGVTEVDKYQGIFALVLRHNAIELLDSMRCLFNHPQIVNIHGEVKHLKCFLEGLPKLDTRTHNLKHLLSQVGKLNIKTRLVIHKLMNNVNGISIIMDNELPLLIEKAKLIRAEIENIPPLPQLPILMPSHISLTNGLGFIVSLLQNLSHLLNSKIDWIATIYDCLKLIYEELQKLSYFLKEISNQLTWNGFIDDDLQRDIIQVASKAEYVVDTIMLNDGHLSCLISQLYNVREEAKLINKKIASMFHDEKKVIELNEKRAKFQDDTKVGHTIVASSQFMTRDEEFVGFEEETKIIIDQLTGGSVELDVIPIIGMGGSGKTTLAGKVYSQREIVDHFDIQAWCTVSQNYDKKELLFEIYNQVCKAKGEESMDYNFTEDKVADELRKSLMGNRYLIVLDDMWDTKVWDDFCRLLSQGEKQGSRIIITTRLDNVASYTKCYVNPLHLRPLNQEESWKLLLKKTFQNGNLPQELSGVGDKILQKCLGLPLMIVLVAGILSRHDPEAHQWDEVAENLSSHITTGEDSSMMAIELSYKHLPDNLKPCFLYFGAFEEDEEISASRLINLWIGEGFVQKSEESVLEDEAKKYLNDLICCSLVMVKRWRRCSVEAKACGVHDLVHAFCLKRARKENFMQRIQRDDDIMSCLIFDNYRLSVGPLDYNNRYNHIKRLCWLRDFGVRSLVWTSSSYYFSSSSLFECRDEYLRLFYKFKLVRILDLLSMHNVYYPMLYSGLRSLVQLKYLALCVSRFDEFPSNLLNLQTLLVRQTASSYHDIILPKTIWRMVHVRHIHLPWLKLHGYGLEFFDGSSDLDNLQSIATVDLRYCEDDNKNIMRKFPNLLKIKCRVLSFEDEVENCYQFPKLDFLHQLESLHMSGYTSPEIDRCKFYMPPNLKRLKLDGFLLLWRQISGIPTLANLEKLLLYHALRDQKWDVEDYVFPKLKILGLHFLPIQEWVASANSFPCLQELVLSGLHFLKEVPSCFEEIYTLNKIEIAYCINSVVLSVMNIKKEREEMGGEALAIHVAVADNLPVRISSMSGEGE